MIYCQFVSSNISIFKSTCVEHLALTVNSLITSTCIHAFTFLNIMHKIRMHAFMLLTNSSILFLYTSLYPKGFLTPPAVCGKGRRRYLQFKTWEGLPA